MMDFDFSTPYTPGFISAVPRPGTVDDVPAKELVSLTARTYVLCALAWDYVDTVLNIAARQRVGKKVSREVRALKRDYDQQRASSLSDKDVAAEMELALNFEDIVRNDLSRLSFALANETSRRRLDADRRELHAAVYAAITVMRAVRIWSGKAEALLIRYRVPVNARGMTTVFDSFVALFGVIPKFLGNEYAPPADCDTTARILANRMNQAIINFT